MTAVAPGRAPQARPPAARPPRVALICHRGERLDAEGLACWLAATFSLVGIVAIDEPRGRRLRRARSEIRRSGVLGFLDVLAFRLWYRLRQARADAAWTAAQVARLRARYPADLAAVPGVVVADPNGAAARAFLSDRRPELVVARCKTLLAPEVFAIPPGGTFVLHPGICPEYRNAHGCFWALASRDLERVGMTLLRVDRGVDTGPIYLQAGYAFDEAGESHAVIQARVVLENLDAIAGALLGAWRGERPALGVAGRRSAVWGQPRLSAYARWKRAARRGKPRCG